MKRLSRNMQKLSERAEQLKKIVNEAPGRVAGVQQSLAAATEKLQMVRADLVASSDALRGRSDSDPAGLLKDIGAVGQLLDGSGFALTGVDWEMGSARRARIHITRTGATQLVKLRTLLANNDRQPAARVVLTALIQAQEAAAEVEVADLLWTAVTVDLGPMPAVRLGWRDLKTQAAVETEEEVAEVSMPKPVVPVTQSNQIASSSSGSIFQPRSVTITPSVNQVTTAVSATTVTPAPAGRPSLSSISRSEPIKLTRGARGRDESMSLDRFKKMPRVGR